MILKDALIREAIETNILKDEICNDMTYKIIDSHWCQMLAQKERGGEKVKFPISAKRKMKNKPFETEEASAEVKMFF